MKITGWTLPLCGLLGGFLALGQTQQPASPSAELDAQQAQLDSIKAHFRATHVDGTPYPAHITEMQNSIDSYRRSVGRTGGGGGAGGTYGGGANRFPVTAGASKDVQIASGVANVLLNVFEARQAAIQQEREEAAAREEAEQATQDREDARQALEQSRQQMLAAMAQGQQQTEEDARQLALARAVARPLLPDPLLSLLDGGAAADPEPPSGVSPGLAAYLGEWGFYGDPGSSSAGGTSRQSSAGTREDPNGLKRNLDEWGFYDVSGVARPAPSSNPGWAEAPELPPPPRRGSGATPIPTNQPAGGSAATVNEPSAWDPFAEEEQSQRAEQARRAAQLAEDRATLPEDPTERLATLRGLMSRYPDRIRPLLQEEERRQGLPVTPNPAPQLAVAPRPIVSAESAPQSTSQSAQQPGQLGLAARFAGQVGQETMDTLGNELFGQLRASELPDVKEAARSGAASQARDLAYEAAEAARANLPDEAGDRVDAARIFTRAVEGGPSLGGRIEAARDNLGYVARRIRREMGHDLRAAEEELGFDAAGFLDELFSFGSPKKAETKEE